MCGTTVLTMYYSCTCIYMLHVAIHDQKTNFTGQKVFILISTILTWTRTKPLNAVSNYESIHNYNSFAFLVHLYTYHKFQFGSSNHKFCILLMSIVLFMNTHCANRMNLTYHSLRKSIDDDDHIHILKTTLLLRNC